MLLTLINEISASDVLVNVSKLLKTNPGHWIERVNELIKGKARGQDSWND